MNRPEAIRTHGSMTLMGAGMQNVMQSPTMARHSAVMQKPQMYNSGGMPI
jgi:hypothetical protein